VAKAKKQRSATHTWKVTRRNNHSVTVAAETLNVIDGELVFSTKGVVVRIIAADTYSDVELVQET